jgi:hypothetical protein
MNAPRFAILWHDGRLHLATRHIEILNTNKWTRVSLHHLIVPGPALSMP